MKTVDSVLEAIQLMSDSELKKNKLPNYMFVTIARIHNFHGCGLGELQQSHNWV